MYACKASENTKIKNKKLLEFRFERLKGKIKQHTFNRYFPRMDCKKQKNIITKGNSN